MKYRPPQQGHSAETAATITRLKYRIKRLEEELMDMKNKHAALVADVALYEDRGERIKRLEEAHSWRPIETASFDQTWVLGYDANDGETGMIIFDRAHSLDDDGRECHWTDGMREWTPTHWMPLPEPPKAKEAKL